MWLIGFGYRRTVLQLYIIENNNISCNILFISSLINKYNYLFAYKEDFVRKS